MVESVRKLSRPERWTKIITFCQIRLVLWCDPKSQSSRGVCSKVFVHYPEWIKQMITFEIVHKGTEGIVQSEKVHQEKKKKRKHTDRTCGKEGVLRKRA